MTMLYVPDENVMILAQKVQDDHGNIDITCHSLIIAILENPNAIIVLDNYLWGQYQSQINKIPPGLIVPPNLLKLLFQSGVGPLDEDRNYCHKVTWLPTPPPFPEEAEIPSGSKKDTKIVRLAIAAKACLITTDRPLREALDALSIPEKYQIQVLSPEEALTLLKNKNPAP